MLFGDNVDLEKTRNIVSQPFDRSESVIFIGWNDIREDNIITIHAQLQS